MVAPDDKFEKFDKIICSSSSKIPWKRPSWPHSANWYPRVASHSSSSNPSLTSLIRASPPATRSSDSVSSTRRGHSASIATIHRGTASWSARLTSHWASASVSCTLCQVSEDSQEMSIEYYKYSCTFEDHIVVSLVSKVQHSISFSLILSWHFIFIIYWYKPKFERWYFILKSMRSMLKVCKR